MLVLWGSSNPCNPEDPSEIIFDPGPDYAYCNVDRNVRNHETNYLLPSRESPSMGITAFVVYTERPITEIMIRKLLIIPARTLASFTRRIEEVLCAPWQDILWLRFNFFRFLRIPISFNLRY